MFDAPRELTEKQVRLFALADVVERAGKFDMRQSHHPCRTPGCIAGHVVAASEVNLNSYLEPRWDEVRLVAQTYLRLTDREANTLFQPTCEEVCYGANPGDHDWITNAHAASVLRNFALTGKIDWSVGKEENPDD